MFTRYASMKPNFQNFSVNLWILREKNCSSFEPNQSSSHFRFFVSLESKRCSIALINQMEPCLVSGFCFVSGEQNFTWAFPVFVLPVVQLIWLRFSHLQNRSHGFYTFSDGHHSIVLRAAVASSSFSHIFKSGKSVVWTEHLVKGVKWVFVDFSLFI